MNTTTYNYMKEYQKKHGRPPTMQEIADATELQWRSSVRYALTVLKREGAAEEIKKPNEARRWKAI